MDNSTPTPMHQTVGQLVREKPSRYRVFESLKIDFCCGGKRLLSEACTQKGLDAQKVLEQLSMADAEPERGVDTVDPDSMTLSDLADHIEREHHAYLRREFPRLDAITDKVVRVHGAKDPRLVVVRKAFCDLRDELTTHMMKEERILFPLIRQLEQAQGPVASNCGSVANPIRQMEAEHDDAGNALATIREATDEFQPPECACNTHRAMLDGLAQLERDLHLHIHKENNVLFPRAIELEALL